MREACSRVHYHSDCSSNRGSEHAGYFVHGPQGHRYIPHATSLPSRAIQPRNRNL